MEQIKFRSWDNKENKFWYFALQEILERRMSYRGSFDEKILVGEKTQYIGISDINNVDIYEGDILEDEEGFYVVRFDEKCSSFVLDVYGVSGMTLESGWDETAGEFKIIETLYVDDFYQVPKVIGNIYENGELVNR